MNRASSVVSQLEQRGGVELCSIGWTKMTEILITFDLLPTSLEHLPEGITVMGRSEDGQPTIGTVSLGEAPGAFFSAIHHYLRTHRCGCLFAALLSLAKYITFFKELTGAVACLTYFHHFQNSRLFPKCRGAVACLLHSPCIDMLSRE